MNNLLWLDRIQPSEREQVGDRAFYLSHIARKGYPVVPGFVVSAQKLREFWQIHNWQEPWFAELLYSPLHLNADDPHQLQAIAQQIRHEITTAELPPEWLCALESELEDWSTPTLMVQPSLSVPSLVGQKTSWQLAQLLDPHGSPSKPEALDRALKRTWAELFRARSLFCWQRYGISLEHINLAVLVQPLPQAMAGGWLEMSPTRLEIQATFGLGSAISLGAVIPDFYQVHPETGIVQSQYLGQKTCAYKLTDTGWQANLLSEAEQNQYALPESDLQALIQLAQNLLKELGYPFRLEWMLPTTESDSQSCLSVLQIYPLDHPVETPSMHPIALRKSPANPQDRSPIQGLAASGGIAMASALAIEHGHETPQKMTPGQILVAPAISPHWLPLLRQAAGVVTEQGGVTSHGAILARELGIPAVVGATNATQQIQTGDWIRIDGDRGEVYLMTETSEFNSLKTREPETKEVGVFPIPIATQLLLNLSQPSLISQAAELPVDGVGLIRAELMALDVLDARSPQHWIEQGQQEDLVARLSHHLSQFSRAFAPRPVFYRSFDLNVAEGEKNPVLGVHGAFAYQLDPTLFELELSALAQVRQSGCSNLQLILPFVRSVEEFRFCRRRVEQAGLMQQSSFQLWMMAEVPAVVFLLPEFVQAGVQGISIGSNDLAQLILAADREQPQMASVYDGRHPAVMGAIRQLIETARQLGIPCSICGDSPLRDSESIEALVRWGITAVSVPPDAVESTYRAIARAEQRLLLEAARRQLRENK